MPDDNATLNRKVAEMLELPVEREAENGRLFTFHTQKHQWIRKFLDHECTFDFCTDLNAAVEACRVLGFPNVIIVHSEDDSKWGATVAEADDEGKSGLGRADSPALALVRAIVAAKGGEG